MTEPLDGVVVVDKPVGPTSFAIVRQARAATGARKVGHGGTLDPLASGVLPLCFGEATKLAQFLLDADKEYEATFAFGTETDTYDAGGSVTEERSAAHLVADDVRRALRGFVGAQMQVPPMYSALKRDGRPLYSYAREGESVEREPRAVSLHVIDLKEFRPAAPPEIAQPQSSAATTAAPDRQPAAVSQPRARVFVRCSKGTYIRTLAFDLGRVLGTGAHLVALRRTRSGPFGLDQAIAPEALGTSRQSLVSPADALAHLPTVIVPQDVAQALVHGKAITWSRAGDIEGVVNQDNGGLVRILEPAGHLLAVAPAGSSEDLIRTLRVFRSSVQGLR